MAGAVDNGDGEQRRRPLGVNRASLLDRSAWASDSACEAAGVNEVALHFDHQFTVLPVTPLPLLRSARWIRLDELIAMPSRSVSMAGIASDATRDRVGVSTEPVVRIEAPGEDGPLTKNGGKTGSCYSSQDNRSRAAA